MWFINVMIKMWKGHACYTKMGNFYYQVDGMDIVLNVVDEFDDQMRKPRAGAFSRSQTTTLTSLYSLQRYIHKY